MTAPLRDQVAEVAVAHLLYGDDDSPSLCGCGLVEPDEVYQANDAPTSARWHAAHLADVIATLIEQREREVRAEAWDEGARAAGGYGHEDGWTHDMNPFGDNPYRAQAER